MLKNYFKIAWRNLWKHKAFSILNLSGLSISLAACLLIFLWATEELAYDQAAANASRVYRAGLTLQVANQPDKEFAVTSPLLAPVLLNDFPEVDKAVRLRPSTVLVNYKNEHFFSDKFFYADTAFFSLFGYPLLKGAPKSVLNGTKSAVVSESMAKRLFGDAEKAVGQSVAINDTTLLVVSGVAKDVPAAAHFHFDIVAPLALLGTAELQGWWNDSYYTYLLLKNPASASLLQSKIAAVMDKYNAEQNKKMGLRGLHFLQPLTGIHLHSNLRSELEPNGSLSTLRIVISIAVFLLVVAGINYVNLSTAASFKRAKEIGMRKVTGATASQLVAQFLGESILTVATASVFALALTQLSLPVFNAVAGTQLSLLRQLSLPFALSVIGFVVLLGVVAGAYPALRLSGVRPVRALQKITDKSAGSLSLRKVLVVFQFSFSIVLLIATIVALKQLRFMQSQNLGLDKEQVIAINLRNQQESDAEEVIKDEFQKAGGVITATASSSTPGKRLSNITVLPEGVSQSHTQTMNTLVVDYGFMDTYKLSLVAGRPFSKAFADSSSFVLNETAVKDLGWGSAENAVGKGFEWGLGKKGKVIGVVKDFHFNSLQQKIGPVVMHIMPASSGWYEFLSARVNTANVQSAVQSLRTAWANVFPDHPFDYFFVDEDYNKQYKTERRLGNLTLIFSLLTLFISCLGLIGLVMIAVGQRTKEIGIRKVLGASVPGLAVLLSKDFLTLVGIAALVSFPLAWWSMNKWLNDFAYRIDMRWEFLGAAGAAVLLVAMLTVSFHTIKAAVANPVKNLRTE